MLLILWIFFFGLGFHLGNNTAREESACRVDFDGMKQIASLSFSLLFFILWISAEKYLNEFLSFCGDWSMFFTSCYFFHLKLFCTEKKTHWISVLLFFSFKTILHWKKKPIGYQYCLVFFIVKTLVSFALLVLCTFIVFYF